MPKKGFTSLSFNSKIYDYWFKNYQKNKEKIKMKGISSFSSYLIKIISENKQKGETMLLFSKVSLNDDILLIKDNTSKEDIELQIQHSRIFCKKHKSANCIHVGFAYSLPEVYPLLE